MRFYCTSSIYLSIYCKLINWSGASLPNCCLFISANTIQNRHPTLHTFHIHRRPPIRRANLFGSTRGTSLNFSSYHRPGPPPPIGSHHIKHNEHMKVQLRQTHVGRILHSSPGLLVQLGSRYLLRLVFVCSSIIRSQTAPNLSSVLNPFGLAPISKGNATDRTRIKPDYYYFYPRDSSQANIWPL